jgi:hypothetical protein
MSRQSESEGSSDGTGERDSCEGGTCEEDAVSVEGIRNLVSGFGCQKVCSCKGGLQDRNQSAS